VTGWGIGGSSRVSLYAQFNLNFVTTYIVHENECTRNILLFLCVNLIKNLTWLFFCFNSRNHIEIFTHCLLVITAENMKHIVLCMIATIVKILLLVCQTESGTAGKRILNGHLSTRKLHKFFKFFIIPSLQYAVKS